MELVYSGLKALRGNRRSIVLALLLSLLIQFLTVVMVWVAALAIEAPNKCPRVYVIRDNLKSGLGIDYFAGFQPVPPVDDFAGKKPNWLAKTIRANIFGEFLKAFGAHHRERSRRLVNFNGGHLRHAKKRAQRRMTPPGVSTTLTIGLRAL